MKLSRVNKCPVYNPEAGYHNLTGLTPTDVYLGDAPKAVYHPKFPTRLPTTNSIRPGNGTVPLYINQHANAAPANHNQNYAPETSWVKLQSGFEQSLKKHELQQQTVNLHRHQDAYDIVGGRNLEETAADLLRKMILSL